ncbi:hypothetical protein H5R88_08600 [Limosilactobacillus sp. WF-MT5-A]|uniref:beta family protein n=1 Tax=Limosilactobacillus agrestis TaxID=2759748 RepID=UPI0015F9FACE|nr:hypothetical protein [Limosilactobacillus agrestis]MBB1100141.1 hypothetical protein [Limosilactobacillus agrestis]MCD7127335.1 beta family protein [Limosilactobacillus agrestis]
MPVLEDKKGEIDAIDKLSNVVKENILPLFFINVPSVTPRDKNKIENEDNVTADKIINEKLETKLLKLSGLGIKRILIDMTRCKNLETVIHYIISMKQLDNLVIIDHNNFNKKSSDYIYISKDYFNLLNSKKLSKYKNIIFDLQYIGKSNTQIVINEAMAALKNASKHSNIFLVSGVVPIAVPHNAQPINSDDYRILRSEKIIFNAVKEQVDKKMKLNYGDYTTVPPEKFENETIQYSSTPVQIKYTEANYYYFFRNGKRSGKYSYLPNCEKVKKLSNFNKDHCWGDTFIWNDKCPRKGNTTQWAAVSINHHITLCAREN